MKKRIYIQPEMDTMVLPEGLLMQDPNPASGGSFPSVFPANPAPGRNNVPDSPHL